jgi:arylsulfatase A-like enzyme
MLLMSIWLGCSAEMPIPEQPNIILITIESLRPDHVGSYGSTRPTTPGLDRFAEQAVVYEDAHSVTSWTLASHASLFTGLYPSAHGANQSRSRLDDMPTIARLLSDAGYQTAGFASGPYLARSHNLNQGFEFYDDSPATVGTQGGAHKDVTNGKMVSALGRFLQKERDSKRPLFLFAYFWDPHYDYIPPDPFKTMFLDDQTTSINLEGYESNSLISPELQEGEHRYILAQYDAEIAWTDHTLQKVFAQLRKDHLWEDSLVIITSDHGEEFFDHGQKGHKKSLYVESVHVPLLIKFPRSSRTGRDGRLVSLVDLFSTVLEFAGITDVPAHQGHSLLQSETEDRSIFFELLASSYLRTNDEREYTRRDEEWFAVRKGGSKLVTVPDENRRELYSVATDPREVYEIAITDPQRVQVLESLIAQWREESRQLSESRETSEAQLSEDQLERLRALGYLEREVTDPVGPRE